MSPESEAWMEWYKSDEYARQECLRQALSTVQAARGYNTANTSGISGTMLAAEVLEVAERYRKYIKGESK